MLQALVFYTLPTFELTLFLRFNNLDHWCSSEVESMGCDLAKPACFDRVCQWASWKKTIWEHSRMKIDGQGSMFRVSWQWKWVSQHIAVINCDSHLWFSRFFCAFPGFWHVRGFPSMEPHWCFCSLLVLRAGPRFRFRSCACRCSVANPLLAKFYTSQPHWARQSLHGPIAEAPWN